MITPCPISAPQLRVFIETDPEKAFSRIQARAQPGDAEVTMLYLQQIQQQHRRWFQELSEPRPAGKDSTAVKMIDGNKPLEAVADELRKLINFLTGYRIHHSLGP